MTRRVETAVELCELQLLQLRDLTRDLHSLGQFTADNSPNTQWVTRQVGGDLVRRGWGKVFSASGVEGKKVSGLERLR